jgi:hypothetical protein
MLHTLSFVTDTVQCEQGTVPLNGAPCWWLMQTIDDKVCRKDCKVVDMLIWSLICENIWELVVFVFLSAFFTWSLEWGNKQVDWSWRETQGLIWSLCWREKSLSLPGVELQSPLVPPVAWSLLIAYRSTAQRVSENMCLCSFECFCINSVVSV